MIKLQTEPTAWEVFKRVATGFIVRRLMALIAGSTIGVGIEEGDLTIIIGGAIGFIGYAVWSWYQTKTLARTNPQELKDPETTNYPQETTQV